MNNYYTSALISMLLASGVTAEAGNPLCIKESKYNPSNILTSEKYNHYDDGCLLNISRNELEQNIVLKKYDEKGNLIQTDERYFDEWDNKWFISGKIEYGYNDLNQLEWKKSYVSGWDGSLSMSYYNEYQYNEKGYLIKELGYQSDEKAKILLDIEYLDFNEGGKPTRRNSYSHYDGNISLYGYIEYLYNGNFDLTQETIYEMNVFTNAIELSSKKSWIFDENNRLDQFLSFTNRSEEGLTNDKKIDYTYDSQNGLLSSEINYYWNTTSEAWAKTTTNKFTYADNLASDKAPANLSVTTDGTNTLSWEAPAFTEGLTGYNVYNGNELVATTNAQTLSFVPETMPEGTSPWFITSVYGKNEANATPYLDLEYTSTEVYPTPTFGGISYVRELEYGNLEFDVYWNIPETDMTVSGYYVYFNHWQQNDNPIKGTTHTFSVMRYNTTATFGVAAVYENGKTSEEDYREYNLDDLASAISNSAMGRQVWSFAGNICVDGSQIHSVEIFDASGMKVAQQSLKEGITTFNLPKSVYIVKAYTEKGILSQKLFNE